MPVFVVLVRGINVGGRVLPMKRLVELVEKAGGADVRTYIQSGNVVCKSKATADALGAKIGAAILASEGYEPRVMVLSVADFEAAIAANPYPVGDPKLTHVFFLDAPPAAENLAKLDAIKTPTERYTLDGTTFYFHAPDGLGISKLAASFEKVAKVAATARNWRTITALQELARSYGADDTKVMRSKTATAAAIAKASKTATAKPRTATSKKPTTRGR